MYDTFRLITITIIIVAVAPVREESGFRLRKIWST
jgi:hypothetical protein